MRRKFNRVYANIIWKLWVQKYWIIVLQIFMMTIYMRIIIYHYNKNITNKTFFVLENLKKK